jgi:dimethylhistidine N-methyltransferase
MLPPTSLTTVGRLTSIAVGGARFSDFAADVRRGLMGMPKQLSCCYLYDAEGSALFERICALPEYDVTRQEVALLQAHAEEIVGSCSTNAVVVELGSGSATKTRVLLEAMLRRSPRVRYVPIDISRSMLAESSRALIEEYDRLEVTAVAGEYGAGLDWLSRQPWREMLILWLGSNVGNFGREEAVLFLRDVRATMAPHDRLLIGIDLRKPRAELEAAYDDSAGVTAAFNKNLLARINRELGGHFDLEAFAHRAIWNERFGRMEMHLVAAQEQRVRIEALGLTVRFAAGETIWTESSYKYSVREIDELAAAAHLSVEARWLDPRARFCVNLFAAVRDPADSPVRRAPPAARG